MLARLRPDHLLDQCPALEAARGDAVPTHLGEAAGVFGRTAGGADDRIAAPAANSSPMIQFGQEW